MNSLGTVMLTDYLNSEITDQKISEKIHTQEFIDSIKSSEEYKSGIQRGSYVAKFGVKDYFDFIENNYQFGLILKDFNLREDRNIEAEFDVMANPLGRIFQYFYVNGYIPEINICGIGKEDLSDFCFKGFVLGNYKHNEQQVKTDEIQRIVESFYRKY